MKRLIAVLIAAAFMISGVASAAALDWFSFTFGSYSSGEWDYSIYEYDGRYYLDAQGLNGVDLNVVKKKISQEDVTELMDIITDCSIVSWDGFDESSRALEGVDGFKIDISYKNGALIKATGYGEYPSGYWDAWTLLTEYFDELTSD